MNDITQVNKLGELSNYQIESYLRYYPEFRGCFARDEIPFDRLKEALKLYPMVGCIVNLAPHNKSGTHWTLLTLKRYPRLIAYYYDPFGAPPPEEIVEAIDEIILSHDTYQGYDDSDCGWLDMFIFLHMWTHKTSPNPLDKALEYFSTNAAHNKDLARKFFQDISVFVNASDAHV